MNKQPMLFSGSSHEELAKQICAELKIPLGRMRLEEFPDGEINVEILENVRGQDVFVVQTIAKNPNYYLLELLIIIDALKRSSARSIVAVIPYLGYCRQDRKNKPGVPITAKLVANILTTAGITRLVTFDLHADQVEGFFESPVDHLHCQALLGDVAKKLIGENCIVVAPDIGSIKIAEKMAKLLGVELAVMQKQRKSPFEVEMTLIGSVKDKNVLIVDDLCSTGGTLVAATHVCKKYGAKKVIAAVTHGLFVANAIKNIQAADALEAFLITNTIPYENDSSNSVKIEVVSIASMAANVIENICQMTHS